MPEQGSRKPASTHTASDNLSIIDKELGKPLTLNQLMRSDSLRNELEAKGLKGFKKGGKVKKTGPAKLHKGEFVVKAPAAKKAGPSKLKALNQSQRDVAMLKRKKA